MNKIFKVIWSKSKQCYIVVSEMAKNTTGKKKIIVGAILAGLATQGCNVMAAGAGTPATSNNVWGKTTPGGVAIGPNTEALGASAIDPATGKARVAPSIAIGLSSKSEGLDTITIGIGAGNSRSYGISMGKQTNVTGDYGIAIGYQTSVTSDHAVAIGEQTRAPKMGATVMGVSARGYGQGSVSLGWQALAGADVYGSGININSDPYTDTKADITNYQKWGDTAVGLRAVATGGNATALGRSARAAAENAIAIGGGNGNSFNNNTEKTEASADKATAIGYNAKATAGDTLALGTSSKASGSDALAIGKNANASNSDSIAIGQDTVSNNINSVALGKTSKATGASATALGPQAKATGSTAVAIGLNSEANQSATVAVGYNSAASGENAAAYGNTAKAAGKNSLALGANTQATVEGGVALGAGSIANTVAGAGYNPNTGRTNTFTGLSGNALTSTWAAVSIGDGTNTRQLTGLAAGTNNTDAVNVAQLKSMNLAFTADGSTKGDVNLTNSALNVVGDSTYITTKGNNQTLTISGKKQTITVTDGTASASAGMADANNVAQAINQANAAQTISYKANGGTANTVKVSDGLNFTNGTTTVATIGANGQVTYDLNTTTKQSITDSSTAVNRTIALGGSTGSTTAKKLASGDVKFNIKGQTGTNALISTSASGDDVTIAPTSKLTDAVTAAENAANKDLSNLSTAGNTYIKNLAKTAAAWNVSTNGSGTTAVSGGDTVNFVNGDNIAVTNTGRTITIGTDKNVSFDKVTVGGLSIDKTNGINAGNKEIKGVVAGTTATSAVNKQQMDDAVKAASDATTALGKNTIALGSDSGSTTAKKLSTSAITFNIKGDTGASALITTTATGDNVSITPTAKLTNAVAAAENAANKNLSNISSSGETVIKNLAKGAAQDAVKVAGTGLATVSDNTTGGVKTYTVDVNTGNLVVTANGQVGAAGTTGVSGATGSNGVATTQNVATAINDAVTKAKASTTQALADAEHKFAGDTGTTSVRKHGEVLSIKGGVTNAADLTTGNIGVVSDGAGTLNIRLAKVLSGLTSATFTTAGGSTTVINGDGVTITPSGTGASAISMTTDGINAGGTEIKNIADGTAADSAVSKGQMETAIANAQTAATSTEKVVAKTLSGDTNLATVTGQTGTAKGETYEVAVSENAVKNVAKAAAQDAVTVTGTGLATVSDNTAAGVKTYTVNVDEGKLVIDDTTGKVGAAGSTQGTTAGKNGVATTQNVATAINDAVTKANANNAQALADAKHNFAGDDATVISRKHGEQLNIKGGASTTATDLTSGNIAVVGDTTTGTLNIKMAKALTGLTSATFTDGSGNTQTITGGSSTITDGAGNTTAMTKGGLSTTDGTNTTTVAPAGVTATDGTNTVKLNGSGIDAGNTQIKNVGKATTDDAAVNKKQMDDAVKAASDATKALGDNTVSLGSESGSTTAKKLSTTGGITFNIKGDTGTNALITTSATGDNVTIAPTAKLTAAVTAAEKSADKDLSNITSAGKTVIKDLAATSAQDAVKVTGTGLATVSDNTAGGVKTYTVNVEEGKLVLDDTTGQIGANGATQGTTAGKNGIATTQNVATAINDAVTKAKASTTQALADAEHKFDGDTGTTSVRKHGEVLSIKGGVTTPADLTTGNIGVVSDGAGTLNVRLAKALTGLTSATFTDAAGNTQTVTGGSSTISDAAGNSTVVSKGGVTTTDAAGNTTTTAPTGVTVTPAGTGTTPISVTTSGISAGNKEIKNIANGTTDDAAVNKKQMDDAITKATADATHEFGGDDTTVISRKHGEKLTIKGGASTTATDLTSGNIAVVGDTTTGTLNIKMAKALTGLTSATFSDGSGNTQTVTGGSSTITDGAGNTTAMTKDGLSTTDGTNTTTVAPAGVTATDGTNTVKLNGSGIDAGNTQIKNVGKATTDDAAVNKKQMDDAVKAASDATKALGDNTVSLGSESGSTTAKKLSTTGGITFNIKGDTGANALITTSATGDNVTIAPTAKLTAAVTAAEKSADKDLSNISSAGKTVIKDLAVTSAQDAVNVTGTGLATVSDNIAGGVKTYTVDVKAGNLVVDANGQVGANGATGTGGAAGTDGVATTQNVATAINDAITKSNANTAQALADAEHKFDGDTGATSVRKHGEVLSIKGGVTTPADLATGNIGVVSDGAGTLNIRLAKVLNGLTSATFKDASGNTTMVTGGSTTIADTSGNTQTLAPTKSEIKDNNGVSTVTTKDGVTAKDASGNTTSLTKGGLSTTDGTNTTTVAPTGMTATDGTNTVKVEGSGIDAGNTEIKHIAAGTSADSAVNKGQMDDAITKATTNATHEFGGDDATVVSRKHGEKLTIKGGATTTDADLTSGNIAVIGDATNGALNIKLAKALTGLTSATFKDASGNTTMVTGGSTTIADTSGNTQTLAPTKSEIKDNNGVSTVTTKDGVTAKDASGNITSLTKGGVDATDGNGHTTGLTNGGLSTTDGTNTTTVAPTGMTATDGTNTVKLNGSGIDAGNTQIKNVGKATTDDAAVNKKQMDDAITKATADATHEFGGDDATVVSRKHGEKLTIKGGASTNASDLTSGNIAVIGDATNGALNIKLAKALTGLTSATFTDTAGNTTTVTGGSTTIADTSGNTQTLAPTKSEIKDNNGVSTVTTKDGVTAKDASGQTTSLTKGGVDATDGNGNTTSLTNTGVSATDGNGHTTGLTNGGLSTTDGTNTTTVAPTGITATDGTNTVKLNGSGIDAGGTEIKNVGKATTDDAAVNKKQMDDAITKATADATHDFAGDDATVISRKHGEQLNIKGGASTTATDLTSGNIAVIGDTTTGTLNIKLAKVLTGLTSATFTDTSGNTTTVTGGSTTIADTSGNTQTLAPTKSEIKDNNGVSTVTTKDGVTAKDASGNITSLTKGGVDATDGNGHTTGLTNGGLSTTDGKNTTTVVPTGITATDGSHTVKVEGSGIDAGNTEIKHIAAGTSADSAVNKGQMDDAITKATADATHEFAGDTGSNSVRKHGEVLSIKGGVTDTNKLSDNNIGVISDGAGTLNVKLSKNLTGLTSATFTDGSGNTQTVTGASSTITDGTGNTTAMTKGGLSTTDGTNTTTVAPTGVTATDGTNIVKLNGSGIDAGNTEIKNVGKATSDDAAVNKKQMDEAVKAASDATKALGNNTITLGDASGSTTTAKTLNTTGGIQFNIKGQTGTDALITTSASGDDVTITPTAKLTAAVTAAEKSADKDLSNLSAAGNTHIQDLAKSAASWNVQTNGKDTTAVVGGDTVNFINGDNIAITNTGHAITIGTAKNVSFDKVTVGGMTLDKNGILSGISSITGSGNGAPTMTFNSQNGNTPANVSINSNLDMGGHRITGVGPAEKPTDAVNKQQVDQALRGLTGLADNAARQYASKAGANAAALAALKPIQYDPLEPTQIMAGVGNYKSQTAVALGMAHYTNENTMFNIGVSLDSHDNMVNAGVTHKFGYSPEKKAIPDRYKGGPISSIYVMQDEMQSLLAKDQEKDAVISKQASEIDTLRQQNEDMQRKIDMILAKLQ